jgi:predicted transcriptional regulator
VEKVLNPPKYTPRTVIFLGGFMKSVLMSIQAKHNRNIESGAKKAELRTVAPKLETPFKVYTYESGLDGRHKVVNEWICNDITTWLMYIGLPAHLSIVACVSNDYIWKYCDRGRKDICEMRISALKVYDKPKELSEFGVKRPPQSWCYVEV